MGSKICSFTTGIYFRSPIYIQAGGVLVPFKPKTQEEQKLNRETIQDENSRLRSFHATNP